MSECRNMLDICQRIATHFAAGQHQGNGPCKFGVVKRPNLWRTVRSPRPAPFSRERTGRDLPQRTAVRARHDRKRP